MEYKFLNPEIEKKDLYTQTSHPIEDLLLQNNKDQIERLFEFFEGSENFLFVNGFLGTGKYEVVDYSTSFLSEDTIVLSYNCFNATVLDDILLAFFKDLKELVLKQKIMPPRIKTENFAQKINSYFSHVDKPFVVIINSFESILDENKKEICDFIHHLTTIGKVKTIVIGRTFDSAAFKDNHVERLTMYALEKDSVEKYLKQEGFKLTASESDEFYKLSRGYYFFVTLCVRYMQRNKLKPADFFKNLKASFLSFEKFLLKQSLSMVPQIKINMFWFLVLIRHEISIDLLKIFDFYNKEALDELIENKIVSVDKENIYISNFFDDSVELAPPSLIHKMRFFLINLYQSQLPLKPLERNICISRQTMRKEIEYHKMFLPKMYRPNLLEIQQISSAVDIGYGDDTADYYQGQKLEAQKSSEKDKPNAILSETITPLSETKDDIGKVDLDKILAPLTHKENKEVNSDLPFTELLRRLNIAQKEYEYDAVVEYAKKALQMKTEPDYNKYAPVLYEKCAFAYKKLSKYDLSLEYYEYVEKIYQNAGLTDKIATVKFNIADICYETYKMQKAKELFLHIVNNPNSPKNLVAASYLRLAGIEEDASGDADTSEYYKKAMQISSEVTNKKVLAELYFRTALLKDDENDINEAKKYYEKCIEINDEKLNTFLSSAYSNLASMYLEAGNDEKAIELFTGAYEADLKNKNVEGVYDSASKLALLLKRRDSEKALLYFKIALRASEQNNDKFYTVSACLELGDFFYEKKDDKNALENYMKALDIAKTSLAKDNINKINIRINDVKFRIGENEFNKLVENINDQKRIEEIKANAPKD